MSLRSTTGTWVARTTDGRLIGPFDGANPARQFRAECQRNGITIRLMRLWPPHEARVALRRQASDTARP